MCAGSWVAAKKVNAYLAGLKMNDFPHSREKRESESDIQEVVREKERWRHGECA